VPDGSRIAVVGLVLVRQCPSLASSVMFIAIEDEGAIACLAVWQCMPERHRSVALGSRISGVAGRVLRQGKVIHLLASVGMKDWPGRKPRGIYIHDLCLGSSIRCEPETLGEEETRMSTIG
jgi:hypothetical protein